MVDRCATAPTEEFSEKVELNTYKKHPNLIALAKAVLTIPVSNTNSERVFSQVNLIKAVHRNHCSCTGQGVAELKKETYLKMKQCLETKQTLMHAVEGFT